MAKLSEIASTAAGKFKEAVAALSGDTGIFKTLKKEHGEISMLFRRIDVGESAGDRDLERRAELFRMIKTELIAHARAEEVHLYGPLQQYRRTQALASHGRMEHQDMERLIREMESLSPVQAEWMARFKMLRMKALEHFQQEEHELFPLAHRVISRDRARDLDDLYRSERSRQAQGQGGLPPEERH